MLLHLRPALGVFLEQLLGLGGADEAEIVHLVLPHAKRLEQLFHSFRVGPLPVAALALDELVALDSLARQQAALDLGAHGLAPLLDQIDLGHGDAQVVVARLAVRHLRHQIGEVVQCRGAVDDVGHLGAQGRARRLGLAEAALLLAGAEVAVDADVGDR